MTHDPFLLECELCHRELSDDGHCRTETCPRFSDEPDEVDPLAEMTEEQLVFFNARHGTSPEDSRRMLERCMAMFRAKLDEFDSIQRAVDAMINEGAPPPPAWRDP